MGCCCKFKVLEFHACLHCYISLYSNSVAHPAQWEQILSALQNPMMPLIPPVRLKRQTGGSFWVGLPSEQHLQAALLCTEEATCFSIGGFLKPQCLMWASLNHTTCSLNMNYIHLCSMTSGFPTTTTTLAPSPGSPLLLLSYCAIE